MNPPAHYRKYWRLEDEHPRIYKDAKSLLMNYVISSGSTNLEKTDSLTQVAKRMGFKVETIENPDAPGQYGWDISGTSTERFFEFVEGVRSIRRGNFESETVQLADLIIEYSVEVPWYKRILSFFNNQN